MPATNEMIHLSLLALLEFEAITKHKLPQCALMWSQPICSSFVWDLLLQIFRKNSVLFKLKTDFVEIILKEPV